MSLASVSWASWKTILSVLYVDQIWTKSLHLFSFSEWGVLPDDDGQWQSSFWPGGFFLHHRGDRQHHFRVHPQKQRKTKSLFFFPQLVHITGLRYIFFWHLQDIFAVAVSLSTGKIIYISDQAASILNCKRDAFKDSKFVEFLMPQDISVFYSFTTPYRLPSWSMCTGAGTKSYMSLSKPVAKFR